MASVPHQSSLAANERAAGRALPAELLPYAAAQLLPLLLLSPERVRTLDLSGLGSLSGTNVVSVVLRDRLVRPQLPALRPFSE